ncbi:MAG: LPS assembly lipoprotein LptE [Bryobacteraceae bacterium]
MKRLGSCLLALLIACGGCGYHVSGRADTLPTSIRTIAIPAFSNLTTRYKLTEQLPAAITREFITRTRYRVVPDEEDGDAVLTGAVVAYTSAPTTYDPATGRASAVNLSVVLNLSLRERATGKVLFARERMEYRERYEISVDPSAYFEESDAALARLSRDVARAVVSAVLERF